MHDFDQRMDRSSLEFPYILSEAFTIEMISYSQADVVGLKKNNAIITIHQQTVICQLT